MPKRLDLVGERFGRLTVIKDIGNTTYGKSLWLCKCDCGNEKAVSSSNLKNKSIQSCGCLIKEIQTSKRFITNSDDKVENLLAWLDRNIYYNCLNGGLYWKPGNSGREPPHTRAGSLTKDKRRKIPVTVNGKTFRIFEYHLIFLSFNGYLPKIIDHKNLDRDDNRIDNIREATN